MHSKMEDEIKLFLTENNISFEEQKTFSWLKYKDNMYLDFYLPDYNIAIECQGEQHFNRFRWENDDEKLKIRRDRDKIKKFLCEELHNIYVLYYSNIKIEENIINNKKDLLKSILKYEKN